jgi:pimeloyl-ACP methyl ester carboxylesterase
MHNMERLDDGTIRPWLTLDRHLTVLKGLWEHTPSRLWSHIPVPVLFTPAAKGNDAHTQSKRKQIAHALETLPRARAEWFEPADHDLHAQFPERFAAVVDDAISTGFFS